jgi:hypothetical protein
MGFILVVVRPFGPYATGDRITDPKEVDAVLAGEHAGCVVKTVAQGGKEG